MKSSLPTAMLIIIILSVNIFAQNVRPVRDDIGFCWNAPDMNKFMEYLISTYDSETKFDSENLIAGIAPHDDYLYSGAVAYPLIKLIKTKEVVIFGLTHGTVRRAVGDPNNVLILDNFDQWFGPYGNVDISPLREEIKKNLSPEYFIVNDTAQMLEHSIEAMIPYLQYYNPGIKITPIMITQMDFELMENISGRLSEIIAGYVNDNNLKLGEDIFFLISNDCNHYGEDFNNTPYGVDKAGHKKGTDNDKRIADKCFNGLIDEEKIATVPEELWMGEGKENIPLWCGRYPITFGLLTTTEIVQSVTGKNLTGQLFKYSDTYSEQVLPVKNTTMGLTGTFSLKHWVGFLSAGFYIN